MGSLRVWLFRGLVCVAAGLMIASFIMPWWTATISAPRVNLPPDAIRIYGYGLRHELVALSEYIAADETPFYQTVLAWIYIAASVGLLLFSTWLKGRKGRLLLGGIGLIYIAYAAISAFVVVAGRLGDLGMNLQGASFFIASGEGGAFIYSGLRFGYYLAYAAGVACIALALLRNIIVGRPQLGYR